MVASNNALSSAWLVGFVLTSGSARPGTIKSFDWNVASLSGVSRAERCSSLQLADAAAVEMSSESVARLQKLAPVKAAQRHINDRISNAMTPSRAGQGYPRAS